MVSSGKKVDILVRYYEIEAETRALLDKAERLKNLYLAGVTHLNENDEPYYDADVIPITRGRA